jgi:NADPH-dependent curcumin reductase CurA
MQQLQAFTVSCRVTESKNKDYSVGDYVVGGFGWVDRAIGPTPNCVKLDTSVPADKHSTGLGVLGMPGYATIVMVL